MVKFFVFLLFFAFLCSFTSAIPLRSLFLRSYDDINQESIARGYFAPQPVDDDNADNRPKRGIDLLKRRVEIIERNRCFFNPITCY
ncbi:Neuropeptide [Caenorhabditis elegans]|uniref:Neuropeptide n=1 Tax=Caenorhabditis elegans TaxID=6239 RepID=O44779_CAEEL|nr:Neuropeptide [Caenorhabditis elegans]CCD66441.1 Neuropeptide [Caenorhabditis elegans]|eukprot:NP_491699.2 Neuropeptide-Like Protein [Caenorhabditis elegans]